MLEIRQLKLNIDHDEKDIENALKKRLKGIPFSDVKIIRRSIDSRKKDSLKYVLTVVVTVDNEKKALGKLRSDRDISIYKPSTYKPLVNGDKPMRSRPVVVGFGPGGIFAALLLAKNGFKPIVLERGKDVDSRTEDIEDFWKTGVLDTESNVQFGEGGAGAFSDGKLNTQVNDKYGRQTFMLETFVKHGAPWSILVDAKPHIGTDKLKGVIKGIREEIVALGGEVRFGHKLIGIDLDDMKSVKRIRVSSSEGDYSLDTSVLILSIGHSARDTFFMLRDRGFAMEPKAFAVGLRMEHDREFINRSQYGDSKEAKLLPTASYKLTHQANDGRGVFSFCMCPGGFVVNSSSEEGMLVVNGMSNHDRMGKNSNSAIVVTVDPSDFEGNDVFAGVEFQRSLEKKAFELASGKVPVQSFGDFEKCFCERYGKEVSENDDTTVVSEVSPNIKGEYANADLTAILPEYVSGDIIEGVHAFDKRIHGFADPNAMLSGVESRTSSPVRILRGEDFESTEIKGVYPCGEGCGYAGGISSAAMDGLKVAEAVMGVYRPAF